MENEKIETVLAPGQKDLSELSAKVGELIKTYIYDERSSVTKIAAMAGVSEPTIRALHPDSVAKLKNINFNKLISIVNAIGYTIDGLTLKKIK